MKTNVTMRSVVDRDLFGVVIRQETKTSFLNVSDLEAAYETAKVQFGWSDRKIYHILETKASAERLFYILENQGLIKAGFPDFMEQVENEGLIKVLKACGAWRTTGRGATKSTNCNPYIWVLLALELNPMIYAKVVTWLTDSLIINRIEAGDFYKDFARAVAKLQPNYVRLSRALNHVIFGKHETGLRNQATQEQLAELVDLEKKLAFIIDMGYIQTEEQLLEELRKLWYQRWSKTSMMLSVKNVG
jgi:hypothetical protein